MKKRIITCIVIIILSVLFLPLPKKIERTYLGTNTETNKEVTITLNMKYLRFLVLDDKLYGEITVKDGDKTTTYGDSLYYVGMWHTNNEDEFCHTLSGFYFNDETYIKDYGDGILGSNVVGFEIANCHISPDFNKILLYHKPREEAQDNRLRQYIGNTDEKDLENTQEYFTGFIK